MDLRGIKPQQLEENWQVSQILATASCAPCVLSVFHCHVCSQEFGSETWKTLLKKGRKPFPSSATDEFFCGRN